MRPSGIMAVVFVLVLQGCGSAQGPVYDGLPAAGEAVRAGGFELACGDTTGRHAAGWLLTVTGGQCLTCQRIGLVLRSADRRTPSPDSGDLWVVTPLEDTGLVCAYARSERVRMPVAAIGMSRRLRSDLSRQFAVLQLTDSGTVVVGRNSDVLQVVKTLGDLPSPSE